MTVPRKAPTAADIPPEVSPQVCSRIAARIFSSSTAPNVQKITRLLGGVSADVYRLDVSFADGTHTSVVLRAHRESHAGHPAELEHQLLQGLHQQGLPVPQPLHVDASCTTLPQPFLVIEFINGNSEIASNDQTRCIERMAQQLAAIHQASTTHLPDLPQRVDPLPDVFAYLPQGPEWDTLRACLHTLSGTRYNHPPKLLHGDFWPENLLWQNGDIAAVLDWEDAALGDPLSDVAACRVELRYKLGQAAMDKFTQAYVAHLPGNATINPTRLALWQVYVAAAAQKYMGLWGLEAAREAHMRKEALKCIREAASVLLGDTL